MSIEISILSVMVTGIVVYIFLKLYNIYIDIKNKKYIEKQKEKDTYQLKYNWSDM